MHPNLVYISMHLNKVDVWIRHFYLRHTSMCQWSCQKLLIDQFIYFIKKPLSAWKTIVRDISSLRRGTWPHPFSKTHKLVFIWAKNDLTFMNLLLWIQICCILHWFFMVPHSYSSHLVQIFHKLWIFWFIFLGSQDKKVRSI